MTLGHKFVTISPNYFNLCPKVFELTYFRRIGLFMIGCLILLAYGYCLLLSEVEETFAS